VPFVILNVRSTQESFYVDDDLNRTNSTSSVPGPNNKNVINYINDTSDSDIMLTPCLRTKDSHVIAEDQKFSVDAISATKTVSNTDSTDVTTPFVLEYRSLPVKVKHSIAESDEMHSQSLKVHTPTHTGEKSFTCLQCSRQFTSKQNLNRHTLLVLHTDEKPFTCSQCDKQFKTRQALKLHTRLHTGEKPFTCLQCNRQFRTKQMFNVHTWSHR